ncbi:hypothetical protein GCM10020220_056150 [Nonomuraea rubra]
MRRGAARVEGGEAAVGEQSVELHEVALSVADGSGLRGGLLTIMGGTAGERQDARQREEQDVLAPDAVAEMPPNGRRARPLLP